MTARQGDEAKSSIVLSGVQQKNPAARGEAKRRGRNREEAKTIYFDDTNFLRLV
jgi:hypothetical protein